MPNFTTLWHPADAPDPSKAPPMDLEGIMAAGISGYQVGQSFKEARGVRSAEKAANAKGQSAASTLEFLNKYNIPIDPSTGVTMSDLHVPGGVLGGLAHAIAGGPAVKAQLGDPMYDVHRKAAEQNLALNKLTLDEALDKRDDHLASKAAFLEFGQFVGEAIQTGQATNPNVQANILKWMAQHPAMMNEPAFAPLIAEYKASRLLGEQAKAIQNATENFGKPTKQEVRTETGVTTFDDEADIKKMLSLFRATNEMHRLDQGERRLGQGDERLKFNELQGGVQADSNAPQDMDSSANIFSQMMDFLKAKRAARTPDSASPPPDQVTGLPSDLPSPLAPPDALSPSIVTPAPPQAVPALTRKRATFTPVERPLQAGEASKLQAQHVEAQQGLFQISQLENQIRQHPEAFGPLSEFRSWAEVVRGLTDDNADATVNAVKEQAGTTFVSLARTLRPDSGNMSHFELMELKKIGDLRRVQNVPSVALAKADIIKAMIVAKDLNILQTLKPDNTKRKVDDFLLTQIRPVDLKGIINSGLLKTPDIDQWYELRHKRRKKGSE